MTELRAKKGDPRDEKVVDTAPLADAGVCRRLQDVLLVATGSRSGRRAGPGNLCPTLRYTM